MGFRLAVSSISFALTATTAISDAESDGKIIYSSWSCAALAGLTEEHEELGTILFERGYALLSQYLVGIERGTIEAEAIENWPVGLVWRLSGGPSVDFRLGALWTFFVNDTYDETWPDIEGVSFDEGAEIQKLEADRLFRNRNCEALALQ